MQNFPPSFASRRVGVRLFRPRDFRHAVASTRTTEEFRISDPRTNDRIRVPEVRLVGPAGEQVGVVRIEVALRLAQEADLLLLDEPFNGMDAGSEEVYIDVLRELTAGGRTALVSTHHLGTVERLADSVALLNGRLVAHGPVAETTTPNVLSTLLGARLPGAADSARGATASPVTDRAVS